MREEVPDYERLQEAATAATGAGATRVLELGIGTGERRGGCSHHRAATLVGLDAGREMLDHARDALPVERVELRLARLEDPLPDGPFDVIVSVLAVHHLDGTGRPSCSGAPRAPSRRAGVWWSATWSSQTTPPTS